MSKKTEFDLEEAMKALQSIQDLAGKEDLLEQGLLTPLIKQLTEAALKAKSEQHVKDEKKPNPKNGYRKKTVKSSVGKFEPETPCDSANSSESRLAKKHKI